MFQGCSNTRRSTNAEHFNFDVFFGRSGGFSNMNPVFEIKSNGEVLRGDHAKSPLIILKKLENSKIDSLYYLINQCNFGSLSIKQVSNITYYIELKSDKVNNKVTWFDESQIPLEVRRLHQFLMQLIK